MNLKLLPLIVLLSPIIAACTPGQINDAIEACKGDPACFEIVDSAIEEELAARGITGGKMTNVEMEQVSTFLESFTLGEGINQINSFKIQEIFEKNSYLESPEDNRILMDSLDATLNDFYNLNNDRLIPSLNIFKLDLLNIENTQLFYTGTGFNSVKNLIYKTGDGVFNYEIYGSKLYIFNIHLELESIFFQEKRYISPVTIFNYYHQNHPWSSIFVNNLYTLHSDGFKYDLYRIENESGIFFEHRGFREYDDCEFACYAKLPGFGLSYRFKSSGITFRLGAGSAGGYPSFITRFSLSIATPSPTVFLGNDYQTIVYDLDESLIGLDLTLEDWLNYAMVTDHAESYSQLLSYTKEAMIEEFRSVFSSYLETSFILDSITY